MADRGWNTEFVPTQGQRGYGQQLARTPKSGWGGAGIFAPFFNPGCTAESPTVFLPVLPIEPSPTTGIQHMIPPLFHGSAARHALAHRGELLKGPTEQQHQPPSREPSPPRENGSSPMPEPPPSARPGKPSAANHDGWQWRKYGEKIVKGSPNPRSYYKCSHAGCTAKKIVERNSHGAILSTEYKGGHCHPAPSAVKASRFRPKVKAEDAPLLAPEEVPPTVRRAARDSAGLLPIPHALKAGEHDDDDGLLDVSGDDNSLPGTQAMSAAFPMPGVPCMWHVPEPAMQLRRRGALGVPVRTAAESPSRHLTSPRLDALAAYAAHAERSFSNGIMDGGVQVQVPQPMPSERKRRRIGAAQQERSSPPGIGDGRVGANGEQLPAQAMTAQQQQQGGTVSGAPPAAADAGAPTSIAVLLQQQQESGGDGCDSQVLVIDEGDSIEDGYKWRKYGQKQVKGNPYPRSYYKCTSSGCTVRKHVERSAEDPTKVVISYEGRHVHSPPLAQALAGRASPPGRSDATGASQEDSELSLAPEPRHIPGLPAAGMHMPGGAGASVGGAHGHSTASPSMGMAGMSAACSSPMHTSMCSLLGDCSGLKSPLPATHAPPAMPGLGHRGFSSPAGMTGLTRMPHTHVGAPQLMMPLLGMSDTGGCAANSLMRSSASMPQQQQQQHTGLRSSSAPDSRQLRSSSGSDGQAQQQQQQQQLKYKQQQQHVGLRPSGGSDVQQHQQQQPPKRNSDSLRNALALAAEAALGGGGANRASEALQLRARQQQQQQQQQQTQVQQRQQAQVQAAASILPAHVLASIGNAPWDSLATLIIPGMVSPATKGAGRKLPDASGQPAAGMHLK